MKAPIRTFILAATMLTGTAASANTPELKYESLDVIGNRVFVKVPQIKISDVWLNFGVDEHDFYSAPGACALFGYGKYQASTLAWQEDADVAWFDSEGGFRTVSPSDSYLKSFTCDLN